MSEGGFFRGTSSEQDSRFSDKQKKLINSMNFPPEFDIKVDIKKVNLPVIKPWVAEKIVDLLGFEDDILVDFVFGMLEKDQFPSPKTMQINITGFLEKDAPDFVHSLWKMLLSAQNNVGGIPTEILQQKKRRNNEKERSTS